MRIDVFFLFLGFWVFVIGESGSELEMEVRMVRGG